MSNCIHDKTYFEDWPDGGYIEICKDCGMSRHHWEYGESGWIMIKNFPEVRKEFSKLLARMSEAVKSRE